MIKIKLDKSQTIGVLLIFSLILNSVIHFTNPAYKFYRENFKAVENRLNTRYDIFTTNVRTNVTDAVVGFYTNIINQVQSISNFSTNSIPLSSIQSDTPILPLIDSIQYSYSFVDGTDYATIGIQHFKVGQVYPRGGLITSINSDSIILDGKYRVSNSSLDNSNRSNNNVK